MNMFNDLKIHSYRIMNGMFTYVYLYRSLGGIKYEFFNFHIDGLCQVTQINIPDGSLFPDTLKPCFCLDDQGFRNLMMAFQKHASENNFKMSADANLEGKLEATKYHLEDLREMLKLSK